MKDIGSTRTETPDRTVGFLGKIGKAIDSAAKTDSSRFHGIAKRTVLCKEIVLRKKVKYLLLFNIPFIGMALCSAELFREYARETAPTKRGRHGDRS